MFDSKICVITSLAVHRHLLHFFSLYHQFIGIVNKKTILFFADCAFFLHFIRFTIIIDFTIFTKNKKKGKDAFTASLHFLFFTG